MIHVEVRPGAYADSVTLMQVSRDVAALPGVRRAQVAMATPLNLDVLAGMGFSVPECTPNDLVVALDADDLDAALFAVTAALGARRPAATEQQVPPRTTRSAVREGRGLVLVSVPGQSATVEAMDALESECDVMIFSDNVPLEEEVALKRYAAQRGLLVMGPDCGTASVGGVGLGFANVVRPGPVGIVAASGTGCQQLMSLLDLAGVGIAAALGVGGRDLSAEVGGLATREALGRLDQDRSVEQIVVVSKPPSPQVAVELEQHVATLSTPVRLALLGVGQPDLTEAALAVLGDLGVPGPEWPAWGQATRSGQGSAWGSLRGLFAGGTLCSEAAIIAGAVLPAERFTMTDFGDDALTQGRAHPMIDPTLRLEHLAQALEDDGIGVILLDVVLGHAAEADPAAMLVPLINGSTKPVVVSCIGTRADPQGLERQAAALAAAGAEVHSSNARATRRALELLE